MKDDEQIATGDLLTYAEVAAILLVEPSTRIPRGCVVPGRGDVRKFADMTVTDRH